MKVIFLLDNGEYVELPPERLQIRQLRPGVAGLGMEVLSPVADEDGAPQANEDGTAKLTPGFRPYVNYNVNLTLPDPASDPLAPGRYEDPQVERAARGTRVRKA